MKFTNLIILTLAGGALISCETTAPSKTKFLSSYDGFEKAPGLSNAQVYRGDVEDLDSDERVYIEPVRVIASEATTGKASAEEIGTLKAQFHSELKEELSKSHTVVNRPGSSTLTVRTALVELHPGNPALFLAGYAPYAGAVSTAIGVATGTVPGASAAAVQAEVIDSRTREQYFAVIDRNQSPKWDPGQGLTRWGAADASFRKWSRQIRKEITAAEQESKPKKEPKAAVKNKETKAASSKES
jgi:hypothetical protein